MLDRGDAQHDVERSGLERELAQVCLYVREPGDVGLREIDAHQPLGTEPDQRRQVCGLGEGVADVENARLTAVARETPRDLDRTFVALRGRVKLTWALAFAACPRCKRDCVVQGTQTRELLARDYVPQQRSARERPRLHSGGGIGEYVRLRITAQRELVQQADEFLVREGGELELGREAGIHEGTIFAAARTTTSTEADDVMPRARRLQLPPQLGL